MFIRHQLFAWLSLMTLTVAQLPTVLVAQDKDRLKFEVYQDASKEFRWRLKAGNGEVLATAGQGYKAKTDCQKGVQRIKTEYDKLAFEVYEDNANEFRWRAKAANGQVVATSSQGYKAKADCEKAIDLIRKGAAKADVEDKT
jgi:uncharacterized protein YegP (UPF0339 family)